MTNVKISIENYESKLKDWKDSVDNREDNLYFISEELNDKDIHKKAWEIGLIISVSFQGFLSKINFVDILNK